MTHTFWLGYLVLVLLVGVIAIRRAVAWPTVLPWRWADRTWPPFAWYVFKHPSLWSRVIKHPGLAAANWVQWRELPEEMGGPPA